MSLEHFTIFSAFAFVAYLVKGISGAGSAIVFNALFLTLLAAGGGAGLTLHDGLYWVAMTDLILSIVMAVVMRRELRFDKVALLLLVGLMPTGLFFSYMLPYLDAGALAVVLGAVVIATGLYLAAKADLPDANPPLATKLAIPMGALAGVLGGLFGMAGPAMFVVLAMDSNNPNVFRGRTMVLTTVSTTLRYVVLTTHEGVFTMPRILTVTVSLPAALIALALGMWLHPRVNARVFRLGLGLLVTLSGAGTLLRYVIEK